MIGDKDQLGSVGPGNVFHEMIVSGMIPTTILDSCFRQEEGSTIVENAVRINQKQTKLIYDDTFEFYTANTPEDASEIIRDLYEEYWKSKGKRTDEIQVLSPLKKIPQLVRMHLMKCSGKWLIPNVVDARKLKMEDVSTEKGTELCRRKTKMRFPMVIWAR